MRSNAELNQEALRKYPGYLLARARWQAFRNFEAHIGGPCQLKPVEFSILVLMDSNEQVSLGQLAQALGVAAPNMTGIVRRLEERGLVERKRAETDRRMQHLALTDAGRKLLREGVAAGRKMDEAWLARLSRAEVGMLLELLAKLSGVPTATR